MPRRARALALGASMAASAVIAASTPTHASGQLPGIRETIAELQVPELSFARPDIDRYDVQGVPVLVLESRELPLVSVYASFKGGYGLFGRGLYAAAMGLPSMVRYGGTQDLPPDSVDELLEYHAVQTSFGTAGGNVTSTVNVLTDQLDPALELWADMLASPRFDQGEIDVWRGRQMESIRRLSDDPARLAFAEFNRLLFGDHPIGWEMELSDIEPERVSTERFHEVHARVMCRENLILGVTGDASWDDVRPRLSTFIETIPPCAGTLPESPTPDIRRGAGVFLIEKELEQSVIVMAHPTDVRLSDSQEYFSAIIGNSILGGGGFSSRILGRVRTDEGFAYGATSLWTTPRRHEGILGAITRTSPSNAVPAIDVILETMEELRASPPTQAEVSTAVDQIVNGFVFNYETPGQVLSRTMLYLVQELPEDWLDRYWSGVQRVSPESILEAFAAHLRPDEMTILIVGDPARMDTDALARFGPVTRLEVR